MKYYTFTTRFNCEIDLPPEPRQRYVCLIPIPNRDTNVGNNDLEFLLKLVEPYRQDLTVCYECMFGWYWLA